MIITEERASELGLPKSTIGNIIRTHYERKGGGYLKCPICGVYLGYAPVTDTGIVDYAAIRNNGLVCSVHGKYRLINAAKTGNMAITIESSDGNILATGAARLNPKDRFNPKLGKTICLGRLRKALGA